MCFVRGNLGTPFSGLLHFPKRCQGLNRTKIPLHMELHRWFLEPVSPDQDFNLRTQLAEFDRAANQAESLKTSADVSATNVATFSRVGRKDRRNSRGVLL